MGDEGGEKDLPITKYLHRIKSYLNDILSNHKVHGKQRNHSSNKIIERKTQSEWKIQLTMKINFVSTLPYSNETRIMHTKSDNIEIIMSSETEEVIRELYKSLLSRYQEGLMKGSHFTFDGLNALYYNRNTVRLSRGKSYIDFPKWLKNKKATINPKNNNDNSFQCAITAALNHEQI